jgi:hypothetical protein
LLAELLVNLCKGAIVKVMMLKEDDREVQMRMWATLSLKAQALNLNGIPSTAQDVNE